MDESLETHLTNLDGTLRIVAGVTQLSYDTKPKIIARDDAWQRVLEGLVGTRYWLKILVWTTPGLFPTEEQFRIWTYVSHGVPVRELHPDHDRVFTASANERSLMGEIEKIIYLLKDKGEDELRKAYGLAPATPLTRTRPVT